MSGAAPECSVRCSDRPPGAPISRALGRGAGWSISEFVCRLGPETPPFEERHERVAISAVVEGSFQYRTTTGKALLYPGSFLLGNAGACYECGHEHGRGDRCLAFHFDAPLFEEIAASAAGSHRFRFATAMLPAIRALTPAVVAVEAAAKGGALFEMEALAIRVAEAAIAAVVGRRAVATLSAKEQRRVGDVIRYVEEHAERPLDLAALAGRACMSKYHFLRTFRRTLGVTPYQFVLGVRMRRAALRLRTTSLPVAAIAFAAGFGDLSTFNSRFRAIFGVSPGAFRRARA